MTNLKRLGIWMDHASAHLMEYNSDGDSSTITSKFTHEAKEHALSKGENGMHNKEQHQQSDYYKKLADTIVHYDSVILFGPTEAKTELLNVLRKDRHFDKLKIQTKVADKMTENQQHAFVKNYFDHK
jgi:stalled ribosome rescue protein Dom34